MIAKIDGTKVADAPTISLASCAGGPKKVVTIVRDGKEMDLNLSWETPAEAKEQAMMVMRRTPRFR